MCEFCGEPQERYDGDVRGRLGQALKGVPYMMESHQFDTHQQIGQVTMSLNETNQALAAVFTAWELLEKRLCVVLRPVAPEPSKAGPTTGPCPDSSELFVRVDALARKLRELHHNIESVTKRLDV